MSLYRARSSTDLNTPTPTCIAPGSCSTMFDVFGAMRWLSSIAGAFRCYNGGILYPKEKA